MVQNYYSMQIFKCIKIGNKEELEVIRELKPPNILLSYWYFKSKSLSEFCEQIGYTPNILLDSGAYSAFTKNKTVNLLEYMNFIRANPMVKDYIALDVIGDSSLTIAFYDIMRIKGFDPIAVYHYGEDQQVLNHYLERGAKTTSDSYILWPAKVGAFSLVMGRHVNNADTSNLPFSYLIEQQNTTYLVPGVNLRSVGTIRDAQKWPKRDKRKDPHRLDQINYNLLSPYTIQKMMKGRQILKDLRRVSGETSETYAYQSAKIKNSSLNKGIQLYETAIHKFLGNSIIKRLEETKFQSDEEIRARLKPDTEIGYGEWVDVSGLIAPKSEIEKLMADIETGVLTDVDGIHGRFVEMHRNYYTYEWTWAFDKMLSFYRLQPESITAKDIVNIVKQWQESVVGLDKMLYADAKKEFSLSAMTGFGADGTREEKEQDFEQVRGVFESNPFVTAVLQHIEVKTALGNELIERISPLVG